MSVLTSPYHLNYGVPALDVSSVGIDTPYPKRAKALLSRAFFVPAVIMVGCMEALRSAACSLGGSINSVQPATLIRLIPCLGGSHTKEDLPMCKDIRTKPSVCSTPEQEKAQQIEELEFRLRSLLDRFSPLSDEFNDVLSISRVLRGRHRLGFRVDGYVQILEQPPVPPKREVFV